MELRKKRRKKEEKHWLFKHNKIQLKKKERFCLGRCKETQREDTGGSISYKS